MLEKIEGWLRARFVRLNGEGAENQTDVYRCQTCGRLITWNIIRSGKSCCAGRLIPASPRWYEAIRLLFLRS